MIRLIIGDFGSGKTTEVFSRIRTDIAEGREAILLVPEQETVSAEQAMAAKLPPSATLVFEVSNFTRLANTVFRRLGGLSFRYADLGTRTLCMWRTMGELLPLLHEKQGALDLGRVREMTAAMRELSALSITPTQLQNAAKQLGDSPRLAEKLQDLSLISALYHSILHEKYDDTAEDLDRLCEILSRENPLAGTSIYVDGFTSFTEQQWRVLRALGRTCPLTFTLTLSEDRRDNPVFLEATETHAHLLRLAAELSLPLECCDLGRTRRAAAPVLRDVLDTLFDGAPIPENGNKGGPVCSENAETDEKTAQKTNPLRVLAAENAMTACEWIASDITRRVMEEGARYRDFAIIARHADKYVGVLDTVFRDAGIPIFLSRHTDISAYAAIKLIYTAYAICTAGWRQGDVISYCKCGLSGIAQADVDVFELYVTRWNLSGKRFRSDERWEMNPDGYRGELSPRSTQILECVNGVKDALIAQLSPLGEACVGERTVREHARALYLFLSSLGLEEKLRYRAEEARLRGDLAESEEEGRLFGVICDALDRLVDTLGETRLNAETFVSLLRLLFGEVSLSRIPSSLDEVTVGSADIIRIGRAKHVYLIGVNEGEFPAYASEDSVFTEGDRRTLASLPACDLTIKPTLLLRASKELFFFARAFSAASESVTALYANKTLGGSPQHPAAVLQNVTARFGIPVTEIATLPVIDKLWTRGLARDSLGILQGSEEGAALATAMAEDEEGRALLRRLATPLVDADCRIAPETASRLFGRGVYLSQSRIDSFVRCPFSYFCKNVLSLDPAETIEFNRLDVGNLLHAMLEEIFVRLAEQGKRLRDLSVDELHRDIETFLHEYLDKICPAPQRTGRFRHLVENLKKTLLPIVDTLHEEFSQAEFYPALFEWDMGEAFRARPLCRIPAQEGEEGIPVRVGGRIDRIDTWERDGKTYFRVVDYKTRGKDFSLDGLDQGQDIQLLLYLFSIWKGDNRSLKEKLGAAELVPAGVMYAAASAAPPTYDGPQEAEKIQSDLRKSPRSGLFLEDLSVLRAMDPAMQGSFIPIRVSTKDGRLYSKDLPKLTTLDRLEELYDRLRAAVTDIAAELAGGQASARPIKTGRSTSCKYCHMAPVCRFAKE